MTMTDPIADLLTRVRNAQGARHASVDVPHSKFKEAITAILKAEGYIKSYAVADARVGKTLKINLKYDVEHRGAIEGIKRVSKPGLRRYANKEELPEVFGGLGISIVSTSSGLMTGKHAKAKGIGGELVAYIW